MILIFLTLFGYCCTLFAELYVLKYGQIIDAKVVDTSDLCRLKHKYLTLLIEGEPKRIKIYGLKCRIEDFPVNSIVKVKRNGFSHIIAIPDNYITIRLILFPLMLILSIVGLIEVLKKQKKQKTKS